MKAVTTDLCGEMKAPPCGAPVRPKMLGRLVLCLWSLEDEVEHLDHLSFTVYTKNPSDNGRDTDPLDTLAPGRSRRLPSDGDADEGCGHVTQPTSSDPLGPADPH